LLKGHVRFATKEACDKVVETFSTTNGSMENIKIKKLTGW
jgi:phosphopantetheinyl transferase (holo-ACP synthase)